MSPMPRREPRTIMEVCIAQKGVVKGARVCSFIVQWCIASNALGREISIEEYADWWKEHVRTAYREQARFREVFPHMSTPQAIANQAIARSEAMQRGVSGVGSLPADLVLA